MIRGSEVLLSFGPSGSNLHALQVDRPMLIASSMGGSVEACKLMLGLLYQDGRKLHAALEKLLLPSEDHGELR